MKWVLSAYACMLYAVILLVRNQLFDFTYFGRHYFYSYSSIHAWLFSFPYTSVFVQASVLLFLCMLVHFLCKRHIHWFATFILLSHAGMYFALTDAVFVGWFGICILLFLSRLQPAWLIAGSLLDPVLAACASITYILVKARRDFFFMILVGLTALYTVVVEPNLSFFMPVFEFSNVGVPIAFLLLGTLSIILVWQEQLRVYLLIYAASLVLSCVSHPVFVLIAWIGSSLLSGYAILTIQRGAWQYEYYRWASYAVLLLVLGFSLLMGFFTIPLQTPTLDQSSAQAYLPFVSKLGVSQTEAPYYAQVDYYVLSDDFFLSRNLSYIRGVLSANLITHVVISQDTYAWDYETQGVLLVLAESSLFSPVLITDTVKIYAFTEGQR